VSGTLTQALLNCERNAHASCEITEKYAIVSETLTQAMLNSVKIFEKGIMLNSVKIFEKGNTLL
jgi:hypothetical protein